MMRSRKITFCVIFLLTIPVALTGCIKPSDRSEYFVKSVIDGDTIELANGKKVRYIGINTPETMKKVGGEWVFDPEPLAITAKEFNRNLVYDRKVRLEFDEEKEDKYSRWLAYVWVDEKMINAELLKEGYATLYTFPPNVKHFSTLLEAEREALYTRRGLWKFLQEVSPDAATGSIGKYRTSKGYIINAFVSPNKIFLNFGKSHQESLTAVIPVRNVPLFSNKGIDPATYYRGRYVEVTGKIIDSNGPQIIIDNPSQIEIVKPVR